MICAGCGRENPENARFCVQCGASLLCCPACGALIAPDYRFCPGCGRAVAAEGVLRSAYSVSDKGSGAGPPLTLPDTEYGIRTTPSPPLLITPEQERRQVAILFADLVGFTALSERLDPETVHAIVQATLTNLAQVVIEHGGHVDKFIGDCIMALFGAPVAHEDDVLRAVAAAVAMLERLEAMSEAIEREHGIRLAMRIGINAGLVVAGEVGRPGDYTVVGDAVNVASRIQGLARPGSVVVTGPVRALASRAFTFAPAGTVSVRNRAAPVEIFELAGAGPAPESAAALAVTPFVGRERELARLREALEEAGAGRGSALWLVAEAGMGKSRLVAEFAAAAGAVVPVLTGHCRGYAAPLYLPFRQWFEQLAGLAGALGLGSEADWGRLLPCPDDLDWLRGALFPERARPPIIDPETAQRVTHRALIQFIRALAERSPLLLVLEDLHWADAPSLELLAALAHEAPRLPVLLLGTMRPDAAGIGSGTELPLGPLDADALWALLCGLLAPHAVSTDAAQWLIAKTQGNPFFVEELARSLQASGDLALREGRWELARPLTELHVPDTVRGVVQARVDALDPIARMVVREAAVLGTPFDTRILQAMTSAPIELEEVLDRLEGARIVAPVDVREPHRRSFHQAITQQVAYETLLSRRRRELHERAAREIEALYVGRESEVIEDLAEHYARSEARGPAIRYLGEAASRAQSLYANERSQVFYNRLLELVTGASPDEALDYSAAAVAAECGLADLESLAGNFDAAIERLRRQIAREPSGLEPEVRAAIRRRLGVVLAKRGEPEAADAELAAALALTERLVSAAGHREAARAWYQRATQDYRRGHYTEAETAVAESEQHAAAAQDPVVQADCLLLRGLVRYDTGRRMEARADLEAARQRKEAVGDLRGMAAALNNLGHLAIDEGRFADARADYGRALALRQRIGHREGIAHTEINLGNVALSLGEWDEAQAHLETAQALCEEMGDAYGTLAAATNRGRLALETGHAREARRRLRAARERARGLEFTNLAVEAHIGLAEAEVALGEAGKAMATAAAARDEAMAAGDPVLVAAATRATAMAAGAAGRLAVAETEFTASLQAFRELGQPLEEARTLVRWAAVMDSSEGAQPLLEEAERLARKLGAAGELARIEALRTRPVSPPSAPGSRRR
jgi:adenylate cyclase